MRLWKLCCSLKLAIVLATLATFLLMGGSLLFPGTPQVFGRLDSMPLGAWLANVASTAPGLCWWFYPFVAAMVLLLANTACCFIDWLLHLGARWRKSGEYLIHLGVVLLLAGYIWGAAAGWRHLALPCTVGELTALPNWPGHYLAVDSFRPELADGGRPVDMISQVRLLAGDRQLLAGEVRINHPLLENGLVITPASFGRTAVGFTFMIAGQRFDLKAGDSLRLADGGRLDMLRFLPDARRQADGQILYRSDRVGTPAFELDYAPVNGRTWHGWYFLLEPPPTPLQPLRLRPLRPLYRSYSNLTVTYDPGARLAATGGLVTAAGCLLALLSFYRKRRRNDRPEI